MSPVKKVLVISTDIALYQRLNSQLSPEEYCFTLVQKTDEELRTSIEEVAPDIIIVDPDISTLRGVEVSLLIRQWTPTPILILTVARTLENQVRALDLAAEDYLSEPFAISHVARQIDHILELNRAESTSES
jgi:two-component system, OmpR family, KDP operon response regulator KdpE